jgi:hypothetical protein
MVALPVLAISIGALAAEGKGDGAAKKPGYRLPASVLVACPVMSRLKLSQEQVSKIKELEAETNKKIAAAFKQCEADGKKKAAYYKQRGELLEALNTAVVAVLDEGQKKKYDAGLAVVKNCKAKIGKLRGEHKKAMSAAGGDKQKRAALQKKYQEQVKPLRQEMEKQLDEKVGKQPEPAEKKTGKKAAKKAE